MRFRCDAKESDGRAVREEDSNADDRRPKDFSCWRRQLDSELEASSLCAVHIRHLLTAVTRLVAAYV